MSITSDKIRQIFTAGDNKRDAGLKTPEEIQRYDDIAYGPDSVWQVLDVYRPKAQAGKILPVIVSVHGGGWVYGDKERYQYYCMDLARRGFAVVNFTYRLAPEHKYPAPLEDTNLVFSWVLKHAEEYQFDAEHVFAVGDSAGGHCLGLYVAICTNPEYAQKYPFTVPDQFVPNAIALNCGVYHITMDVGKDDMNQNLMKDYLPEQGSKEEMELIDVTKHITKNYPPTFLTTSVDDFLKDQLPLMENQLLKCEVPFVCRFYGDSQNRLKHVFHLNIRTADAALCNDEECEFFRSFC